MSISRSNSEVELLQRIETKLAEALEVPWKSNLSSYSASKYESKYSTEDKTPRFGSISTPSNYRPSYSTTSGTYRSVPIKKDIQPSPTPYTSKYSDSKLVNGVDNGTSTSKKSPKPEATSSSSSSKISSQSSYGSTKDLNSSSNKTGSTRNLNSGSTKDSPADKYAANKSSSSLSSTSTSKLSIHSSKPKKDDGPPITYNTRYSGSKTIWSRDPSPAVTDKKQSTSNLLKSRSREPSPATHKPLSRTNSYSQSMLDTKFSKLSINRGRTRDRSPAVEPESKLAQIEARIRSRESSPCDSQSAKSLICRVRSRDPSPCVDYPTKFSIYRSKSRDPSPATESSSTSSKPYLRSSSSISSRQLDKLANSSSSLDKKLPATGSYRRDSFSTSSARRATPEKQSSYSSLNSISKEIIIDEPGPMYSVEVVTRGTSPNPPSSSSSSYTRSRRATMAKTIEKTIQRPVKKPISEDKAVQSDRMDDSTRNSKFANSSARISLSSYVDSKYSGNYTSRYSNLGSSLKNYSSSDNTGKSDMDSRHSGITASDRSNSRKDLRSSEKSSDSYSSPYKSRSDASTNNSRVSETNDLQVKSKTNDENPSSNKTSLPPTTPRSNSISKGTTTSSSSLSKWTNKDFRKSALNMGTPNQTRSGSKSSSSNDIDETDNKSGAAQYFCERSPSTESDSSEASSIESYEEEDSKASKTKASSRTSVLNTPIDDLLQTDDTDNIYNGVSNNINHNDNNNNGVDDCDSCATDVNIKNISEISQYTSTKDKEIVEVGKISENSISSNKPALTIEYPLRHIDSDEHIWSASNSESLVKESPPEARYKPEIVKINLHRIESGEKPWWLTTEGSPSSNHSDPSLQHTKDNRHYGSDEKPWWLTEGSPTSNHSDSNSHQAKGGRQSDNYSSFGKTPNTISSPVKFGVGPETNSDREMELPLSARASPDGLEDNTNHVTTIQNGFVEKAMSNLDQRYDFKSNLLTNLFISRHTNIDDILGVGCNVFNTTDHLNDVNIFDGNSSASNQNGHKGCDGAESIERRNLPNGSPARFATPTPQCENLDQKLDDAAIQIYKEGDYGAYLDLDSSLVEQSEELEGITLSRKNSLVVRTQLSVRVHTIIEKLESSEGRELRRALFTLKQIFQEDKDLVHAFVDLGGLTCLIKIGSNADQNYQNYILRALGQVMLYVDGMNGVMKHEPTVQWLYSLISSQYRLVVKTALKLLLVFVEYTDNNCYLLSNAIRKVEEVNGQTPWASIMRLLKDYNNADTELLIYAVSLINKTLAGLNDQDTFYDESDYLEQQGMESVVHWYMSQNSTDLDLLDQLQLYEAVLKFEDGETDGIHISDLSIRKVLRYRSSNAIEPKERRKSRRFSTGLMSPKSPVLINDSAKTLPRVTTQPELDRSSSQNTNSFGSEQFDEKGIYDEAGVTPALRKRRERAERQSMFIKEQQAAFIKTTKPVIDNKVEPQVDCNRESDESSLQLQLKRDHTVKDLTLKLSNLPMSPQEEKPPSRIGDIIGDMSGLINKAKEGLAKSKSKADIARSPEQEFKKAVEQKKSENEIHWEELVKNLSRPLVLCDLDFTDLTQEDEKDFLAPRDLGGVVPPPPPPMGGIPPPMCIPPPKFNNKLMMKPLEPPSFPAFNDKDSNTLQKNKKTVKLFWKEVREDMIPVAIEKTVWDELPKTKVDFQKLEHLFESRAKDLLTKKQHELNKNKEIIVLDHKRSNAINIAMTKLPPPRAIKAAILKMDATVVTREGIDKLLNMLPTEEERCKIQEAQAAAPELPLGSAENFLLTLSSISELAARLRLWAFKLDFENIEREIAEPLMDLKHGLELLKSSKTFKYILSTLLSIGIFLNGAVVKGFQIEYLAKVPEVKDTVQKHSLLHHLCHMVMEESPDTSDLYSEIGPITRASKADFGELAHNIVYLETECKASWDRLKLISKHDCAAQLKQKLVDFLADCAERIIILEIIHRRVINRYRKFLFWLGVPQHRVSEYKPNEFCRIVSEFALEYRTTRERVQQQIEKKANHRERNKTRGKMIIDIKKFKTQEDSADAELRQLLGSTDAVNGEPTTTSMWRRKRSDAMKENTLLRDDCLTDGDDEIIESLVKTATKSMGPRPTPRERKRTRNIDRKSLRRTLKTGLNEEEKQHVASFIKGY